MIPQLKMTLYVSHGLVKQNHRLSPNPVEVSLFGDPESPVRKDLIDRRELDALMMALRPHALVLANVAKYALAPLATGEPFDRAEMKAAVEFIREMFPVEPIAVPSHVQ